MRGADPPNLSTAVEMEIEIEVMTTLVQAKPTTIAKSDDYVGPRIPTATYRWQFNRSFTFQDARRLVAYLDSLGISDSYASPYFRARAESTHGYDIADHNSLNPSIGNESDYNAFVAELHKAGMGQ